MTPIELADVVPVEPADMAPIEPADMVPVELAKSIPVELADSVPVELAESVEDAEVAKPVELNATLERVLLVALVTVALDDPEGEPTTPSEAIILDAILVVVEIDPLEEMAPAELSKLAKSLDGTGADELVGIRSALVSAL